MDFHLDTLLNLPDITVESCTYQDEEVYLKLRFFTEKSDCPLCHNLSDELRQNRPVLIRDLAVFGAYCLSPCSATSVLLPRVSTLFY